MDLTESIAPRSDQLNAEDLISGPRTVTITEVHAGSAEQPVSVHLAEFPGRPFKPSKTVRRIMVAAWGKESAAYVGRQMTLYRDPDVKFGGQAVGGIRVSAMSGIVKRLSLALTETRGKRVAHVIEPLAEVAAPTRAEPDRIGALMLGLGITAREHALRYVADVVGREVASRDELTESETAVVIEALERDAAGGAA